MDVLAIVVILSLLCEWLTERFFGAWLSGYAMVVMSALIGVALACAFQVDGIALMGLPKPIGAPWTGVVITGLIIGAGSDAVHKFFSSGGRRTV